MQHNFDEISGSSVLFNGYWALLFLYVLLLILVSLAAFAQVQRFERTCIKAFIASLYIFLIVQICLSITCIILGLKVRNFNLNFDEKSFNFVSFSARHRQQNGPGLDDVQRLGCNLHFDGASFHLSLSFGYLCLSEAVFLH